MGSPAHEIFSPLTAPFYLLFSGYEAALASLTLALGLAGLGAYCLAREWTLTRSSSLAFAWTYAFFGPLLSLVDRSPIFIGVAVYPWVAWMLTRFVRQPKWGSWSALGFCLALLFHHGDWIAGAFFVGLMFLVAGWSTLTSTQPGFSRWRVLAGVFGVVVLAWGLAAVVLVPAMENLTMTRRGSGYSFERSSYYSLHPLRLLNLLVPELWGQFYNQDFWGSKLTNAYAAKRFWFHSIYMGIIPVFMGGLAIWWGRRKWWVWTLVAGILGLMLLSFGQYFGLHGILHDKLSAYAKLRYPEKFIIYSQVLWLGLALWAWSQWEKQSPELMNRLWLCFGLYHLGLAVISVAAFPGYEDLVANWDVIGSSANRASVSLLLARFVHIGLGAVGLIVYGLAQTQKLGIPKDLFDWALPFVVLLEMVFFAPSQNTIEADHFAPSQRVQRAIEVSADSRFRVLRDGNLSRFSPNRFRDTWAHNWSSLDGFRYAFGYETIVPDRTERLIGAETFRQLPTWARILNIKYVLSTQKPREKNLKKYFDKVYLQPTGVAADLNLVVLQLNREDKAIEFVSSGVMAETGERSFEMVKERGDRPAPLILETELEPPGYWSIVKSASEVIDLEASQFTVHSFKSSANTWEWDLELESNGFIVIRENYHPAWKAYLNGVEVPVMRGDYVNSAIYSPLGRHQLKMSFEPPGWFWSSWVSVGFMLLTLAIWIIPRWRKAPFPN